MSRSFESLANTFVLAAWPYRVTALPIVLSIFVTGVVWFVINALVSDPIPTIVTLAVIAIGVPIYFFSFSRHEFR